MNLFTEAAKRQGFSVPLHALRGLAAIMVLFKHIQDRLDEAYADIIFPHILNANAAVIFFVTPPVTIQNKSVDCIGTAEAGNAVAPFGICLPESRHEPYSIGLPAQKK